MLIELPRSHYRIVEKPTSREVQTFADPAPLIRIAFGVIFAIAFRLLVFGPIHH